MANPDMNSTAAISHLGSHQFGGLDSLAPWLSSGENGEPFSWCSTDAGAKSESRDPTKSDLRDMARLAMEFKKDFGDANKLAEH